MYKIFIITILTTLLNASNPSAYAVLGDVIYDNIKNIEKLKNFETYSAHEDDPKLCNRKIHL